MPSNPKDLVGAKKAPLRYVPPALALAAAGPMENGAIKYGPFNWREYPVEVVSYIEAVFRHLYAFLDGQDLAEDSGLPHIDHAIAGLGIVADARSNGTLIDNRFLPGPAADILRAMDKTSPPHTLGDGFVLGTFGRVTEVTVTTLPDDVFCRDITSEEWGAGDGPIVEFRGEWPPDTRVAGRLTCCGATEHTLTCPQWR